MPSQPEETEPPFKDYYLILQLHPEADAATIDAAYWHLARRYNAASPADPSANALLDDLNEAYSVLGSSARREKYSKVRNAVLGAGALPTLPPPEPEPPPLAVMEKQRTRSREDATPHGARGPRLNFGQVSVPPWQNALAALVILMLGSAALVAWAHPVLVVALLAIGAGLTTLLLLRKLPRLPTMPALTLHLRTIRTPHLPKRRPASPRLHADALRESTEAIRGRWREGTENEGTSINTPSEPHQGDESSHAASDHDGRP